MALTPNFTASQFSGTPQNITLTDTSTGSDVTITSRRIYLLQANGTFLVPAGTQTDYIVWNIADSSIVLDVLSQDTALSITVQWLNVSNAVVTSLTQSFAFIAYNETFFYGLNQNLVGNANLSASTNWFQNMSNLQLQIDSAQQSITFASDIFNAQAALNRATYISSNSSFFF
jgi:hypothetical protein